MTKLELAAFLADVKAKQEKDDKKKSRFSSEGGDNSFQQNTFIPEDAISNGLWYFYNPETKSKGYNDFIRVWGDRKLEPNWRISNKSGFRDDITTQNIDTTSATVGSKPKLKTTTETTAVSDTSKIPKTEIDFLISDGKIANALFGTGEIFKNNLNNLPKAKLAFDELERRFPNSDYDAKVHYYKYLSFLEQNLSGLAQKEKDYILKNYPQSEVAEALNRKDKQSNGETAESSATLYAATYQAFLDGRYDEVIKNKIIATNKYPSAFEIPQFEFLEAVSLGKSKKFDAYVVALTNIITKYKEGEIKEKAQQYLISYVQIESNLKDNTIQIPVKDTTPKITDTISDKFTVDTTNLWVLVQINDKYVKIADVVSNVQKFNKKHFDDLKIKVNPIFLSGFTVLQLKKFDGITDGMRYLNLIQEKSNTITAGTSLQTVSYYVIAPGNFKWIKQPEDLDKYATFFMNNYIKK